MTDKHGAGWITGGNQVTDGNRIASAIKPWQIARLKQKLRVGDKITLSEHNPWKEGPHVQRTFTITEKHKWIFTAERINRRGHKVTVSVDYVNYLIRGDNTVCRRF